MYKIVTSVVSIALIVGGFAYLVKANNYTSRNARVVSNAPSVGDVSVDDAALSEAPVRIVSKELGIDVQIIAGSKNTTTNEWMLDTNNAFFATETSTPLLYGHNVADIFAGLSRAGTGTEFDLHHDTVTEKYTYLATRFVDPNDASVLSEKNDSDIVMLLTCSGVFNESRRIVYIQKIS